MTFHPLDREARPAYKAALPTGEPTKATGAFAREMGD